MDRRLSAKSGPLAAAGHSLATTGFVHGTEALAQDGGRGKYVVPVQVMKVGVKIWQFIIIFFSGIVVVVLEPVLLWNCPDVVLLMWRAAYFLVAELYIESCLVAEIIIFSFCCSRVFLLLMSLFLAAVLIENLMPAGKTVNPTNPEVAK